MLRFENREWSLIFVSGLLL